MLNARLKCENDIIRTQQMLALKYGEENSKVLVKEYFNFFDVEE